MSTLRTRNLFPLLMLMLAVGLVASAQAATVTSLAEALELSASQNRPVVLDFATSW